MGVSEQISVNDKATPYVESFLAIDPRDTRHMVAAGIAVVGGETRSYPYVSFDAGKTWTRGKFSRDPSGLLGADPALSITETGLSFFVTLPHKVNGAARSVIWRSSDGGRTWTSYSVLPYADREWMAFDPSHGAFSGRIYFTGTGTYTTRSGEESIAPFFASSDDGGRTFTRHILAHNSSEADPNALLIAVPLEPLVSPRGLLIFALQGSPDQKTADELEHQSLEGHRLGLMISDDGGQSFGPVRYAPHILTTLSGDSRRRYRALSAFGNPRTALDTYHNSVFFVAPDYDSTIDRYVARVWRTSDLGKTWDTAVASDAPQGDVGNPAIAVNRQGVIAVTWNDRREDPTGRCWELYASVSMDGGEHFLPSQPLSNHPTCPNDAYNWMTYGTAFDSGQGEGALDHFETGAMIPLRFPNGGETQGLAADESGKFHAAWISGQTGVMQLWHTSFSVVAKPTEQSRNEIVVGNDKTQAPGVSQEMEEVTRAVRFKVVGTHLDFTKHTYTVTVRLRNQGRRPLHGPLRAVMNSFLHSRDMGLGLKDLKVANADSRGQGQGAAWLFPVPGGVLAPGAASSRRTILFTFDGGIPDLPDGYLNPGFRVYATLGPTPAR
ncbi:MAG: hypothetical protein ACRD5M_10200 [Candidatus Acidiferrales bacterium]